jgi:sialate O-acetylesterase
MKQWCFGMGCVVLGLLCAIPTQAEVRLSDVFSDHMVIQRDKPIFVWGWAEPDEEVTVSFHAQTGTATVREDGSWLVPFDPIPAGGGPYTIVAEGSSRVQIDDILLGDVYLASGQSNMEWKVLHSNDAANEIASSYKPNIRLLQIPNRASTYMRPGFDADWEICAPEAVLGFSAVAYFFGKELHDEIKVPIGLIHSSWGGTTVETWISGQSEAAKNSPAFQALNNQWDPVFKSHPTEILHYYNAMGDWLEEAYHGMTGGASIPAFAEAPDTPLALTVFPSAPVICWNEMVAPLWRTGLAGVIWYQGESNVNRAYNYRDLFPTLIEDWREQFGQPRLPFFFVQLANYTEKIDQPGDSAWAELRESQAAALELTHTGMAVTIDIGEAADIHPRDKQTVGKRLALAARKVVYEQNIIHSGPSYRSLKKEGNAIVLSFNFVGDGLVAPSNQSLTGFQIAGEDQQWRWADAVIQGNQINVSHSRMPNPVAVRYGWANNPDCNLYNKEGLPASPFRTDDWKLTTQP